MRKVKINEITNNYNEEENYSKFGTPILAKELAHWVECSHV